MKKILIVFICSLFLLSCGGKKDITNMDPKKYAEIVNELGNLATAEMTEKVKNMKPEEVNPIKIAEETLEVTKKIAEEKYSDIDFSKYFSEIEGNIKSMKETIEEEKNK